VFGTLPIFASGIVNTSVGDVVRVAPNELAFITPQAFSGMNISPALRSNLIQENRYIRF
jgi:hypothetical protein